ncbi:MAG: transcription antitermination factor NusB [Pirellulaceae bacterium]|nr:transcription antitermination factor NusB [Pirellulaceae bacterium]
MTTRRRAREVVLQLLYQADLNPEHQVESADQFLAARLRYNVPLVEFARQLYSSITGHRKQVDAALSQRSANWSLRRMSAIDRNVLRVATGELLFVGTPGPVVINEAIELAKRYGDRNSGGFVNGILDRLYRDQLQNPSNADSQVAQANDLTSAQSDSRTTAAMVIEATARA